MCFPWTQAPAGQLVQTGPQLGGGTTSEIPPVSLSGQRSRSSPQRWHFRETWLFTFFLTSRYLTFKGLLRLFPLVGIPLRWRAAEQGGMWNMMQTSRACVRHGVHSLLLIRSSVFITNVSDVALDSAVGNTVRKAQLPLTGHGRVTWEGGSIYILFQRNSRWSWATSLVPSHHINSLSSAM